MQSNSKKQVKAPFINDSSLTNNSNNYSTNISLFESIQLDNCYRNNPHVPDSEYYSHGD